MKHVFITGASSGIGAALAKRYAEQGATLGLVARRRALLEQLVESLPHAERHRIYALDVTDHKSLAAAATDFIAASGGPDIVIANAGISQGTLTEYAEDLAVFDRIIATNVTATAATFAPFIAVMKQQARSSGRDCRLVGIGSVAGIRGLPGAEAYSASKAAVLSYCESLRLELRASGIKVVTIAPGYVDTPMTRVNTYPMPFLMPASKFAIKAVAAIDAGVSYRVIPWQMGVVAKLLRMLPNWLYDLAFANAPHKPRKNRSMKLIDAIGHEHHPVAPQSPPRIVSLVPSITELLCDLGLASSLVGRTGFCIHPADAVRAIPKVGGTKDVNIGKIRKLAPTHLIVNIDENEKPTVDVLAQFIPHVIVTHPLSPRDNLTLYRLLGGIFGAEGKAEALSAAFEQEYAALAALPKGPPQTMLYCIWKDPWMTISRDTYIARMLAEIGWQAWTPPNAHGRYPAFDWSDALVHSIDGVLLSTEPYRFTEAHVDALEKQIGKPVQLLDGEMLSWYGSRAIAGLRYLRRLAG